MPSENKLDPDLLDYVRWYFDTNKFLSSLSDTRGGTGACSCCGMIDITGKGLRENAAGYGNLIEEYNLMYEFIDTTEQIRKLEGYDNSVFVHEGKLVVFYWRDK